MAELVGTTLAGKYRIKRRIGVGGMGAVYEGENLDIGKRVAIKVIAHEHAQSAELAQRFRREARAASAVESEHIVQVFDVGSDPNAGLYMVMEILSGEDLATRLEREGRLSIEDAVTIALQTARGLSKAHAAGVVHRDLKPANLFLTKREDDSLCVKILDFGISKLQRPDGGDGNAKSSTLTRAGSVMGTPMYMSPEQAQGMPVDARTDIWSLGALVYEALAGRSVWDERDTYEQMIVQIVTQKPKLEALEPYAPAAVVQVVADALVHDAGARIPDASSFARKLAEASKMPVPPASAPDLAVASSTAFAATALATPSRSMTTPMQPIVPVQAATAIGMEVTNRYDPPNRQRLALLAGGIVLLAVVVIGIVALTRTKTETTPPAAAAGLVPTSAPSDTSSAARLAVEPPPIVVESAAAPVAPVASVIATAKPVLGGAGKPVLRANPSAPPGPAKGPSQYGGAGVSTAY